MAKRPLQCNYLKAIIICHGKSEIQIVRHIQSNLHLNAKTYAKDNGEHSIQITSVMSHLNSGRFNSINDFFKHYGKESFEVRGKGANKVINNFKLFIFLDTDDCTEEQKNNFINKQMIIGHWLYEYIVPIYTIPKLESVLEQANLIRRIKDSEKGSYYTKVFPVNDGKPLTDGTIEEIREFREKVATQKEKTNIQDMVDYFLNLARKF